jgi:dihydroorotase/N-acyl-D-amino-acid deacylase
MIGAVENPALLSMQGKRLSEIAKLWNKDPIDALCDFLIQDPSTGVAVFGMSQPDVTLALQQPWVAIDNDSEGTSPEGILGQAHPHPRAYGTFPRILSKYVREEKALTLEDAIRKSSALPAQRMASPIAAFSRKACGPMLWSSIPRRCTTAPPSTIPISFLKEWNTCW